MCEGRLGSKGERGCISERRLQLSDKNRPLCMMVVFIVHQLYKYIYNQVAQSKGLSTAIHARRDMILPVQAISL